MTPVFLWSDLLLWLLTAAAVGAVFWCRRRPHLREPWRRVGRNRLAMGSLTILLVYLCIGLLDSIHFRPTLPGGHRSVEMLSLLDVALGDLRAAGEKSYAAPFAAHLYARERVEQPDGSVRYDYPRLRYGGAHLDDPASERAGDIARKAGVGALEGLLVWSLLAALLLLRRRAGRRIAATAASAASAAGPPPALAASTPGDAPGGALWAALLTAALLCLILFPAIRLGAHYHLLGVDKVGQDVLYQALKGIRTGLIIGLFTTVIMLPFALFFGILAGYLRGWIDDLIQYLYTTLNSIPGVLLIAAAVLMIQLYISNHPDLFETVAERADLRLLFLCLILGVTSWTGLCRLLRGETLKLREMDYIAAARALGVTPLRIVTRHILPNVMHLVLIAVALDFSGLVLAEAVLSYVGVGVDPATISWGNMINGARLEMAREPAVWWSLLAAFLFMFTLVLAANLFADAVREAFDPRMRRR